MEGLGAVVRVNPNNGVTREVATGFTGATNLALAGDRIFVSELYVDQVSVHNRRTGRDPPGGVDPGPGGPGVEGRRPLVDLRRLRRRSARHRQPLIHTPTQGLAEPVREPCVFLGTRVQAGRPGRRRLTRGGPTPTRGRTPRVCPRGDPTTWPRDENQRIEPNIRLPGVGGSATATEGVAVRRSRTVVSIAALAAGAALVVNQSTPASAKPEFAQFDVAPVASGLNGPLQFTLGRGGRPYVAEAYGPGTITKVTAAGAKVTAVDDPGTLIGVALRRGTIAYTWASGETAAAQGAAPGRSQARHR